MGDELVCQSFCLFSCLSNHRKWWIWQRQSFKMAIARFLKICLNLLNAFAGALWKEDDVLRWLEWRRWHILLNREEHLVFLAFLSNIKSLGNSFGNCRQWVLLKDLTKTTNPTIFPPFDQNPAVNKPWINPPGKTEKSSEVI